MKKPITIAGLCCVLPLVVLGIIFLANKKPSALTSNIALAGQEIAIEGRKHVPAGTKVSYQNSNPPTSGDHWPEPAPWGFYTSRLYDEQLVHNLEHGGIWISYKEIDEATKAKLKAIAEKYPQAVIITERQENEAPIAIASWGRLLKFNAFPGEHVLTLEVETTIEQFIKANVNQAPEKLASLEPLAVRVGVPFPDFAVTDIEGRSIINAMLKGKPAIIWFTTSWCVPCQIGARKVAALDNQLGGKAFEVLVIFVDSQESTADLRNWRQQFANPDWLMAFDNELTDLAARVSLRFLDSKFLLDKKGVVRNIDIKIADDNYLDIIGRVVQEG